ncbi:MAG: hypothetical protein QM611_08970 [Microbacterium sp.]|uniref:hypothetical protein n=1 Tax=Microbacterium sp. TaxID=51671 RepID=UPI0039E5E3E8
MVIVITASGGYVDDAVDALATSNVYVSKEVSGASGLTDALLSEIGDSSIGVAVFSSNAELEASGPEIVSELASNTQYDTIIVAVGDDLSAGSHVLPSGEAIRIANEAESSAGGLRPALVETVQEVVAAEPSPPASAGGVDGGVVLAIGVGVAVLAAAAGGAFGILRRRGQRGGTRHAVPDAIRARVAALRSLHGAYAAAGASGDATAARTAADIDTIANNTTELFTRLSSRGDKSGQSGLAAVEYEDKLRKLEAALDHEYLLDILAHPHLWDDPDERIAEVSSAVTAVSDELVQNIKQVNARRGLHFQVSLDGLIGGRKELREWEREFDRASEDGRDQAR